MKKKKLSVKALMSLVLSAILFCMPAGAFFANRANTVEVHAEDTAEQQTESTGNTESTGSTGNTVTPGNGKEENAGEEKRKIPQRAQRKERRKKQPRRQSQRSVPVRKSAASMRWTRTVQCAARITRNVSM